jgi:peptidoglycan/LPS O-acetylase OafA/YrhL
MDAPAPAGSGEVPDVVAPPPHHPRFPLTVGMRGIPAIAIIVGHAWFFTGGFGGFTESLPNRAMVRMDGLVALFFLLSAFLLYRPMIAVRGGRRHRGPGTTQGAASCACTRPTGWR